MKILGIDPGTQKTGFGIIRFSNSEFEYIHSGTITLPAKTDIPPRLEIIYDKIFRLIEVYKPEEFAIETAFYHKNVQSVMKIGYARGVSLLAARHKNLKIIEYSPREVKKAVTGRGSAVKEQVLFMVQKLLNLKQTMPSDESDALAIAICHALKLNSFSPKSSGWKEFIKENPGRVIE